MASTSLCLTGLHGLKTLPCRTYTSSTTSKSAGLRINAGARFRRFQLSPALRRNNGPSALLNVLPQGNSGRDGAAHHSRGFFEILQLVAGGIHRMGQGLRDSIEKPQTPEESQLLACLKGRLACAAAPIFFAAISQSSSVNTPLTVVASGMAKWLELYSGVLMVRVLLSWFPNIPWERQPLQAMRDMCDPYLNLFRNIIPPLFNALDLSPMLAFLVLGVLTSILNTTVQAT